MPTSKNKTHPPKGEKKVIQAVEGAVEGAINAARKTPSRRQKRVRRGLRQGVPVPGPDHSSVLVRPKNVGRRWTFAGRQWAQQYLNPCCSITDRVGVPTGLSTDTSIVNSRVDQEVTAPTNLVSLWTNPQTEDWYLGVIVPNWVDDCVLLIAAAFQPTDFTTLNSLVSSAQDYPNWNQTETTAALATTVWYCKISEPQFQQYADLNTSDNFAEATAYRLVKRGITTELVADDLTNRGKITASQFLIQPLFGMFTAKNSVYVATVSAGSPTTNISATVDVFPCWFMVTGDITPKYLTAADSRAFQGLAKAGCYMPIYLNSQDHKLQPYSWRMVELIAEHDTIGRASGSIADEALVPRKVLNEDQNIGVIWYQGIAGSAGVNVKGRHTIECITEPASTWSGFSAKATAEDKFAIEQAHAVQNQLAHAYPAAYNDWGFLGNIVKGLVSKVPYVGGLLSGLVDPAGKALGGLLGIS